MALIGFGTIDKIRSLYGDFIHTFHLNLVYESPCFIKEIFLYKLISA